MNLAEAYALAGSFDTAIPLLEKALDSARSEENAGVIPEIERRLEAYKQGQPSQAVPK